MSDTGLPGPAQRRRGRLASLARLGVTLVCLGVVLSLVDLRDVGARLASADPALLALAVLGVAFDRALMVAKWYPLLRLQVRSVSLGRAFRVYLAAGLASYVLPSTLGADALRAASLGARDGTVVEVGTSIAMERLLGMIANGLLAALALGVGVQLVPSLRVPLLAACLLVVAGVGALALLLLDRPRAALRRRLEGRLGRWESVARRFGEAARRYRSAHRLLALVGSLTLAEQFLPLLILWVASAALQAPIELLALLVAVPISTLLVRLPISIAGIGPGDAALYTLLSLFGVPGADAVALAVVARGLELLGALPGALFWSDLADGWRAATPGAGTSPAVSPQERA